MAKDTFTFGDAVASAKPYIPYTAIHALAEGSVVTGRVDAVSTFQEDVKLEVEVNGHITVVYAPKSVTLDMARTMINQSIKLKVGKERTNTAGTKSRWLNVAW